VAELKGCGDGNGGERSFWFFEMGLEVAFVRRKMVTVWLN